MDYEIVHLYPNNSKSRYPLKTISRSADTASSGQQTVACAHCLSFINVGGKIPDSMFHESTTLRWCRSRGQLWGRENLNVEAKDFNFNLSFLHCLWAMRLFALSSLLVLAVQGICAESGGLYPPGLLPLINRANALLSTGQFNEAAKAYSEAIGAHLVHMGEYIVYCLVIFNANVCGRACSIETRSFIV
jgi:hypothetical protein